MLDVLGGSMPAVLDVLDGGTPAVLDVLRGGTSAMLGGSMSRGMVASDAHLLASSVIKQNSSHGHTSYWVGKTLQYELCAIATGHPIR